MTWVEAASAGSPDGTLAGLDAGGTRLIVARAHGAWHALEAWCTHAECPLDDGWLEDAAVRCACHGALFDLATGVPIEGPAAEPLRLFPVRVSGDRVEVLIDEPGQTDPAQVLP